MANGCPVARQWRMLESVIGYVRCSHRGGTPEPRTSQLPTNPILAAPVRRLADRRISAGFIVEAATGAPGHFVLALIRALDRRPVISTDRASAAGAAPAGAPRARMVSNSQLAHKWNVYPTWSRPPAASGACVKTRSDRRAPEIHRSQLPQEAQSRPWTWFEYPHLSWWRSFHTGSALVRPPQTCLILKATPSSHGIEFHRSLARERVSARGAVPHQTNRELTRAATPASRRPTMEW